MRQPQLMDHRWSSRQPLALNLTVYDNEHRPLSARTRDISIGGMFLETVSTRLPLNAQVHVVFVHRIDGLPAHYRLPARVIRLQESGTGLMFSDFSASTIRILRKILFVPLTRSGGK